LYLGSALCDIPKDAPQYKDFWKYSPGGQYMVDKIGSCLDGKEALQKFKKRIPLHKISNTITTGRSWKNMNPKDMSERFLKIWDNPQKYRAPNFYRRFALGEINGTITASAQPENCGITHPFENRRFTIREAARIQSFPDDFIFPFKTIANAYKVIGNAVPPIFGWVIAKALTKHIGNG
jgi:DNA (cytosine-5)-methyltransferase 1